MLKSSIIIARYIEFPMLHEESLARNPEKGKQPLEACIGVVSVAEKSGIAQVDGVDIGIRECVN